MLFRYIDEEFNEYFITSYYNSEYCTEVTITLDELINYINDTLENANWHRTIPFINKLIDQIKNNTDEISTKYILYDWVNNGGLDL